MINTIGVHLRSGIVNGHTHTHQKKIINFWVKPTQLLRLMTVICTNNQLLRSDDGNLQMLRSEFYMRTNLHIRRSFEKNDQRLV